MLQNTDGVSNGGARCDMDSMSADARSGCVRWCGVIGGRSVFSDKQLGGEFCGGVAQVRAQMRAT